ncbi:MAG: ester cyclase [Isosphaerales bacterium]
MSAPENKALIQRFFKDVLNRGDLAALDDLCAAGFILEAPGIPNQRGQSQGLPALKEWITSYRTAFPDIRYAILNTVAEDAMIAVDFTASGTQRGAFAGVAPSGKSVEGHELCFTYVSGGKIQRMRFCDYGAPIEQQLRG